MPSATHYVKTCVLGWLLASCSVDLSRLQPKANGDGGGSSETGRDGARDFVDVSAADGKLLVDTLGGGGAVGAPDATEVGSGLDTSGAGPGASDVGAPDAWQADGQAWDAAADAAVVMDSVQGRVDEALDWPSAVLDTAPSLEVAPEIGVEDADRPVDVAGANPDAWDAVKPDAPSGDLATRDALASLTCPATITGSLESTDATQVGRHARIAPVSTCGTAKTFPSTSADSSNAHLYDVYRFVNSANTAVCFNLSLTYLGGPLYAAAYTHFDPTTIATGYLGDVGDVLSSPQTMGITVAGGGAIDVVVYAIAVGTAPAGAYVLSCATP